MGTCLKNGAAALRAEGVQVVINLRDDSPTDEMEQFVDQGIQWINIPVEWRDPQSADFARFSEVMPIPGRPRPGAMFSQLSRLGDDLPLSGDDC